MAKKETYNFESFDSAVSETKEKPSYDFGSFDKEVKKKDGSEISSSVSPEEVQTSTSELIKDSEGYTPPEVSLQEQAQAEQPSLETPELPTSKIEEEITSASDEMVQEAKRKYEESIPLYHKALTGARENLAAQREDLDKRFPEPTKITPTGDPIHPLIVTNKQYAAERDQLNLAEKYIDEVQSVLEANKGNGAISVAKLRGKNFEDLLTIGWSKVLDAGQLKKVAQKSLDGEDLTEQEQTLLAFYGFKEDVKSNVDVPLGYDVVGGMIDMIPYMANIAATGGIGSGIAKASGTIIKETSKKAIGKYAAKGVNYLLGKSGQALAVPMTYEGTLERQVGGVTYDEDGKLKVIKGDDPAAAALKSWGSSVIELGVEGVMDDVIRAGKVADTKGFTSFMRNKTKWGSFKEELIEEFATATIQAPIEGQTLEETFTPRMMATTILSIGGMSAFVKGADMVFGKKGNKDAAKVRADMEAFGALLSSQTKKSIDDVVDKEDDFKEAGRKIEQIIDAGKKDKGWNNEQVFAVTNYFSLRNEDNYFNKGVETAKKEEISEEEAKVEQTPTKEEKVAETPSKEPKTDIKEPKVEPKIKQDEKVLQEKPKEGKGISKEVAKEKDGDGKKEEVLEDTQSGIKETKKADVIPEEGQKELPDNVIKSKDGLFELNEGQVEQRNEMRKKYGKERADELILDFIDSNDLKKYSVDPFVKKVKQIKEDAKKTDKVPTEGKKPTTEKVEESKPESGVREGDKAKAPQKETVKKTEQKEKTLKESDSIASLQDMIASRKVNIHNKEYLQKMEYAQKNRWYDDSDVDQKEAAKFNKKLDFKRTLDKEKEKPQEAGFSFISSPRLFDKSKKRKKIDFTKEIKRQFSRTKGMPLSVFEESVKTQGRIAARQFDIKESVKNLSKDIQSAYGEILSDKQMGDIQEAIESIGATEESLNIALSTIVKNIPKEAIPSIVGMRKMIDSYSNDISKLDMIGVNLSENIDKNRGYYLTRTYKKHTDRDWFWDNIPDKIKEDAFDVMVDLYPEASRDQLMGMIKSMVESKDVISSVMKTGQSLADIDQGILKKRSEFLTDNPEIRALLGENRDPFYNYAVSLAKMSEIAEKGKMLENIRNIGVREGFFTETESYDKNHIEKIKYNQGLYAGKPGVKQLSDYYTTPEIAKAISTYMEGTSIKNPVFKAYMKLITTIKISKTAGSVKGVIRNFKSNTTNALANANWNFVETGAELKNRMTKGNFNNFKRELLAKGIIGDSSNVGELVQNVKDLSDKLSFISSSDETVFEGGARKIKTALLDTYAFADDVWKTYRYVSEYTRYRDAYQKAGINENEALDKAKEDVVEILHRTSTYYSQLPIFIQNMRKLPIANTFISWPYLTLQNYIGTWQIALREIKNPHLAHIGVQRMVGSLMAVSILAAISTLKNRGEGQDEDDMEAWRRFLPSFWENDLITIQKVNEDGTAEYSNPTYMDYYGVVTTPVLMLARKIAANGELTTDDVVEAASEFGRNFLSYDILADRLTNIKANEDRTTGMQIYNPTDDHQFITKDIVDYMWNAVEPGTLTDVKRISKSYKEGKEWERQAMGVLRGNQNRTIDPLKSMRFYKLPKYKDSLNNARRIYTNQLYEYNRIKKGKSKKDEKLLKESYSRSENAINFIVDEARADVDAMIRLGFSRREINETVKSARMDSDVVKAILRGKKIRLTEDGKIE